MSQGEIGAFILLFFTMVLVKDPPTCADLPDTCAAFRDVIFSHPRSSW